MHKKSKKNKKERMKKAVPALKKKVTNQPKSSKRQTTCFPTDQKPREEILRWLSANSASLTMLISSLHQLLFLYHLQTNKGDFTEDISVGRYISPYCIVTIKWDIFLWQ